MNNFIHTHTCTHAYVQHTYMYTEYCRPPFLIYRKKLFHSHLEVRILIPKIKII